MSGIGDVQFWMRARCVPASHAVTPVKRLWEDYRAWCKACGHDATFRRQFVRELAGAGVVVEFVDELGVPTPFKRQGQQMAGKIMFKHAPQAVPERKRLGRPKGVGLGPIGPTGPKRAARWRGAGSVEDAAVVSEWVEDCCAKRVWAEAPLTELYADYELWAEGIDGGEPWHRRGFVILLRGLGYATRTVAGQVRVMGLFLSPERPTAPADVEGAP